MIMISGGSKETLWDMTYNKQRHDKITQSSYKSSLLLLFYFLSISFVIFGLGQHVVTTIIFWWPTAAIKEPNVVKNEATEMVLTILERGISGLHPHVHEFKALSRWSVKIGKNRFTDFSLTQ